MANELKERLLDEEIEVKNFVSMGEVIPPNQTGCGCAGGFC